MMPRYAELVYNGFWFSPERLAMQAAIDTTQQFVEGTVRLKLYKVRREPGAVQYCREAVQRCSVGGAV
jgi:argininosuccinate synthase